MLLLRYLKYFSFVFSTLFVLSFILPFDPSELIDNKSDNRVKITPEIVFTNRNNNSEVDSGNKAQTSNDDRRNEKKMFIILVTGFRTGSTFLGELFNQNPSALYLFEPFHQTHMAALMKKNALHNIKQDRTILEQRTAYLEQIVNDCQVEWPMFKGMSSMMKCGSSQEENMIRFGKPECDQSEQKWENACKYREMTVFKLIRLQRIEHLELVAGIQDANVYVVHLIRDPRGTMNSRTAWGTFYLDDIENLKVRPLTPEKMEIAAGNLCDREWDNIEFTRNLPDWLQGRFLRVTHDEMSLEPVETAEKVYKFVNQKIPDSMSEFLLQHTSSTQKGGMLNTHRNSTEVLAKWHAMELPIIRAVEKKCKKVMEYMGYEPYQPENL